MDCQLETEDIMRLKDYNERDGKRVWLSEAEVQRLLGNVADDVKQQIATQLMARAGLRRREVAGDERGVVFANARETEIGPVIRVWKGKGDKYREVPIPAELHTTIQNLRQFSDREPDAAIVDAHPSTLYDWVQRAAERCHAETNDPGWLELGPHDLRRSWGVRLLEAGVLPSVVMEWGGWEDWQTFRDHYLAEFSPEALRQQRRQVAWLADGSEEPLSPDVNPHSSVPKTGFQKRDY